jgi:hypothetical protein
VLDLSLPAQSSQPLRDLKVNDLKLEVVIRPEAIDVSDQLGGMLPGGHIVNGANGPDIKALAALIQQLKLTFPDKNDATVMAEPNTSYDTLVQVMDAVRAGHQVQGAKIVSTDYFPNISIGDAPIRKQ